MSLTKLSTSQIKLKKLLHSPKVNISKSPQSQWGKSGMIRFVTTWTKWKSSKKSRKSKSNKPVTTHWPVWRLKSIKPKNAKWLPKSKRQFFSKSFSSSNKKSQFMTISQAKQLKLRTFTFRNPSQKQSLTSVKCANKSRWQMKRLKRSQRSSYWSTSKC